MPYFEAPVRHFAIKSIMLVFLPPFAPISAIPANSWRSAMRQVQLGYDRPRMSCWNRSATTCCRQIDRELLHTPETANSIAKNAS
jgi:hypothetical protein